MNEQQVKALTRRDLARHRVEKAREELSNATKELNQAERRLRACILNDPNSWRGTPGVKEGRYA